VYQAVTEGPQWKRNETLFIITFDEHGGTYDDVGPQWGAVPQMVEAAAQSKRVGCAPTFEGVFADKVVNTGTATTG
jgi:hypothetical protein